MMVKVSVIIPTYNRAGLIARAIDSVLVQTFKDFELIIIDDGSKDNTKEAIKPFEGKIKYIYQNNGGISNARNRGIQESSGQYIAFLDSDDYWAPQKLEVQVKILDENPRVGIVYARMPIVNEHGEILGMKPNGISGKNFQELLRVWGDLPTSSVMTRRECFDRVGVFDNDLPPMEDIDMWLRIAHSYEIYEVEGQTLAYYWRHDHQITQDSIKVYLGLVKIHAKILKTFEDIPRELIVHKLVKNQYTLSRIYYKHGRFEEAFQHVSQAIGRFPRIGVLFIEPSDNIFNKALKIFKPYFFIVVCYFKKSMPKSYLPKD
jgi:glycosyltransferase involved in cell wall biosynthesis